MTAVAAELLSALGPAPAPGHAASPYKFLDFYERRDASNFAGRDQEIDDIAAGVARSRCFVLYGRSGLGKTSLLHAGVIPRLEQRGFEVRYLRILVDPVHDLCAAIAIQLGRDTVVDHELPTLLAARPQPFVLVLDQFEEFFIRFRGQPQLQAEFAALLDRLLDDGGDWVRLLISLREDYYTQLKDLEDTIPDLTAHGHRLVSLSAYGVRQAVVRPLIHAQIAYEEPFVDRVIDELAAFDFDPLLLQIVCGEIYNDAVRDARARGDAMVELRAAYIERGGGIQGALTRYVAAVSDRLASDDRLVACAVLDALTTAENTKRAVKLSDLLPPPGIGSATEPPGQRHELRPGFYLRAAPDELHRVLDRLCRARLVRGVHPEAAASSAANATDGDEWYELLHDRLVPVVKNWLDAEPTFDRFRFAKKLIANLCAGHRWRSELGGLLSANQLSQQVEPYALRLLLSPLEAEYVLRSAIHDQRQPVTTWARIYDEAAGAGQSAALVVEFAAHPDPAVRCGAARAITEVADPQHRLPALCLTLALEDSAEEVRRAAGRSLATIARPQELQLIPGALSKLPAPRRSIQVVADLLQFGDPTGAAVFSFATRLAAAWHVRRRRYLEYKGHIRNGSILGVAYGLLGAAAFTIIVGIPSIAILEVFINPDSVTRHWPKEWLLTTARTGGAVLFAALPVGALLGWRTGTRLARRDALGDPIDAWAGSSARSPTSMFVAFVLLLSAGIVAGYQLQGLQKPAILAAVIVAIWWQLGPVAVRWVCRAIAPDCSTVRAAIWSTIAGSALASSASAAIVLLWSVAVGDERVMVPALAILLFLAVGLNFCVTSIVLHGGTKLSLITKPRPVAPETRRSTKMPAVFILAITIPIALGTLLGPGSSPFDPLRTSINGDLHATISGIFSDARPVYFQIQNKTIDLVLAVDSSTSAPDTVVLEGNHTKASVVRTAGSVLGATAGASGKYYDLYLRGIPIHKPDDSPPATIEQWNFILDKVEWVSDHYDGAVKGEVDPSLSGRMIAVQLSWLSDDYECETPSGGVDLRSMGALCLRQFPYLGNVDPSFALLTEVRKGGYWTTAYPVPALIGMNPPLRKPPTLWLVVGYRMLPSAR